MFAFLRKPVPAGVPVAPAVRASGKGPSRMKRSAALGAACISVVGTFEGLRTVAYPDPATRGKPWTVCYGETDGVKAGDRYTVAECKAMLASSLEKYALAVEGCVLSPMTDGAYAAYVSLAYNMAPAASARAPWSACTTPARPAPPATPSSSSTVPPASFSPA